MGADTSVVVALFFVGFLVVAATVYSSIDYDQKQTKNAQYDQDTMKNAKMQTDITIMNASFSNISGDAYLNITLKNTGKTTLNAELLDIFVNGIYYDSSYCISTSNTWVSENITHISIYSKRGNITLDSSTSTAIGAASSITWSHTVGSGLSNTLLIVGVDIQKSTSTYVTGINYAGVALTRANFALGPESPKVRAELWYLTNPEAGTNNVVVTLSTTTGVVAGAVSFSGVDQTNPISNTAINSGGDPPASTLITTANANAWIIDTVASDTSSAMTATSPQVERWDKQPTGVQLRGGGSTKTAITPGSQTMSWSSVTKWAQVVAEIKPSKCNTPTAGRIKVVTENGIWDYAIVS